ncbi:MULTISPECIES: class C sortase [Bacillus cereus group]|uniref:Class C sortase n=1 Tax=Bacillus cereus TaxID=1396 RepID=A0A9W7QFU6_BACCE|nr:class C sortase [Bacillus cereus]KAB2394938.1 class C sortase [Bacillus cereus]KAB2410236.1 class C sortase [Bacillus cereus]KAB2428697.1 class C sortase [Bacillus cereus]
MKKMLLSAILFILGFSIFLYPTVSNYMNQRVYETEISNYEKRVEKLKDEDLRNKFKVMQTYNESLKGLSYAMQDPFNSNDKKNETFVNFIKKDDVLGTVIIPKINEELPIYLGATQEHLSMGVGQIGGTSFPIGGQDTHTVLAGHRGYHGAKMFRHLDQLQKGDKFYIRILGEELTYEVTGHEVILPTQVEKLAITKGKDKATLLTCEPYTSSKYRLLVYGERVNNEPQENSTETMIKIKENQKQDFVKTICFIVIGILVIFIALFGLLRRK